MPEMPAIDPDLHTILAKSDPRESLVTHTWNVLSRLADQAHLRPALADQVGDPRLWHRLYWACFMHDFGKAAGGFQEVLVGKCERWKNRHEVLSLAFVDWAFPAGHSDRSAVISVIATHHRDTDFIVKDYPEDDPAADRVTGLLKEISAADRQKLYRWISEYGLIWAEALGLAAYIQPIALPPLPEALKRVQPKAVHRAIRELNRLVKTYSLERDPGSLVVATIYRGLILTADHAGSAHTEPFPSMVLDRIQGAVKKLHQHQEEARNSPSGSVLLVAPTSSGKTEAALNWVVRQAELDGKPPARLFYTLPYQASMNAMQKRLREKFFPEEQIGLQHGRALLALYRQAMDAETDRKEAALQVRAKIDLAKLNYQPVRVFSPYQMLRAGFQLKGYEALLTDYYGGLFILDEIHAYEPKRLALFVGMIQMLAEHFQARFFIMTATLPPMVRRALADAIPGLHTIEADPALYQAFQRHRVHLLDHDILHPDTLTRIVADVRAGRSVLVCCNTVKRAKTVFGAIQELLPDVPPDDLILVHGRFNGDDRQKKEAHIMDSVAVGRTTRRAMVVVATQVVEVSLNIDLDTLYTEPAPLEALLQRFGRVNRGRPIKEGEQRVLADVYVLREGGESDDYIYAPELVAAALNVLVTIDGNPIDEGQVNTWLSQIYTGEIEAVWRSEYDQRLKEFQEVWLRTMKPFQSSRFGSKEFDQMFDGVQVLPQDVEDAYETTRREKGAIEASGLLISVPYHQVNRNRRLIIEEPNDNHYFYIIDAPYTSDFGLDLETAYQKQERGEAD
ncbi:MAG: CRISPR-associated helicase Cas3' [Aggregatilineales bacterium]